MEAGGSRRKGGCRLGRLEAESRRSRLKLRVRGNRCRLEAEEYLQDMLLLFKINFPESLGFGCIRFRIWRLRFGV